MEALTIGNGKITKENFMQAFEEAQDTYLIEKKGSSVAKVSQVDGKGILTADELEGSLYVTNITKYPTVKVELTSNFEVVKSISTVTSSGGSTSGGTESGGTGEEPDTPGGDATKKVSEVQSDYATKKTTVVDEYNNTFVLPEGFKVRVDETTKNADTVNEGIVIEDKKGNQFVWVPVGNLSIASKEETITKTIELKRYSFNSDGAVKEDESPSTWEASKFTNSIGKEAWMREGKRGILSGVTQALDIEAFMSSAKVNCGFYIGRYEAGVTNYNPGAFMKDYLGRKEWTEYTPIEGKTLELVCMEGKQPWNRVTQYYASKIAKEMYIMTRDGLQSDLCNSFAWGTTLKFIQESSEGSPYSKNIRLQNTLAQTGRATNGAGLDERCNIYDMAGNVYEWETETRTTEDNKYGVYRGGCFASDFSATWKMYEDPMATTEWYGFRPILYL